MKNTYDKNSNVYCVSVGTDYGMSEPDVFEFETLEDAKGFFNEFSVRDEYMLARNQHYRPSKFDKTVYAILEEVEYAEDKEYAGAYEIDYKEYGRDEYEADEEKVVYNKYGSSVDYEASLHYMDEDVKKEVDQFDYKDAQEYFDAYCGAHKEKFGVEWEMNRRAPIW